MNSNETKEIFLMKLPELTEPLKSAVEFALANWHKLNREPRPSDVAINFFASLPALPTNDVDLASKICRMNNGATLSATKGFIKSATLGASRVFTLKVDEFSDILRTCLLHVLVDKAFIANPQKLPVVHHIDDNKINSCIWNLVWMTRSENTKLAYKSGIMKRRHGQENFNARLTDDQVRYIRKHYIPYDKIFGAHALARKFNVVPTVIIDVVRFRTYKYVV